MNRGDGTFIDVALGPELSGIWTVHAQAFADKHGAAWADFDNDGDLDLYISTGQKNENQFLLNDGGRLLYRTAEYDPLIPSWGGRLPIWFDYTGDGLLDLFMAAENITAIFEQTALRVGRTAPRK